MNAPVQSAPPLFAFVRTHRTALAAALMLLVFAAFALDYFDSAQLGPRLLYLRLIYAVISALIVGYVYIVSTMTDKPGQP